MDTCPEKHFCFVLLQPVCEGMDEYTYISSFISESHAKKPVAYTTKNACCRHFVPLFIFTSVSRKFLCRYIVHDL